MTEERRASWLELFFDLVLVAGVAALAQQLHEDHSLAGLAVFAGLFVPVWWAWWGFTWYSAAFNDDDTVNRIGMLAGMGGVAALAAGVDGAAHGNSTVFVVAYAFVFALLAALYARAWRRFPQPRRLSLRYAVGDLAGAAVCLSSLAFAEGVRPLVWVVGMAILMAMPVRAAASQEVLSYDARHIAERYGLFTLIVLGESVAGTVAGVDPGSSLPAVLVAVLGLVLAAAVWWSYFDRWRGMPSGGLRSGWVWAQGHYLVFAGIAAAAVGVELLVEAAAEGEPTELTTRLPLGAGLAAYLLAMAAIRAATRSPDQVVAWRAGAAALIGAVTLLDLAPLLTAVLVTAILVAETAVDLIRAPAPEAHERPVLPHELARRRGVQPEPD